MIYFSRCISVYTCSCWRHFDWWCDPDKPVSGLRWN